jgi:hypothetical protein
LATPIIVPEETAVVAEKISAAMPRAFFIEPTGDEDDEGASSD